MSRSGPLSCLEMLLILDVIPETAVHLMTRGANLRTKPLHRGWRAKDGKNPETQWHHRATALECHGATFAFDIFFWKIIHSLNELRQIKFFFFSYPVTKCIPTIWNILSSHRIKSYVYQILSVVCQKSILTSNLLELTVVQHCELFNNTELHTLKLLTW